MPHTMEEDFQHFLSYSGLRVKRPDIINELRQAFEAAWEESGLTPRAADGNQVVLDGTFPCPECHFTEKHLASCSRR